MSREPHVVADVTSAEELIRYAAEAQVALLERWTSQNVIGLAIGMGTSLKGAGSNLSHALKTGPLSDVRLQRLDEVAVALAPPTVMHTGGLSSLAISLRGYRDRDSLTDRVPATWTREILQTPAETEVGVLTQASALLSSFLAAENLDKASRKSRAVLAVHDRYYDEIKHVVEQLIILGYAPPTSRSVEALIMLGTLGSFAFDIMQPILEVALKRPLGFRVWRAVTKLVQLSRSESNYEDDLRSWVSQLLGEAEELRNISIYTGRSLDLELAISVPSDWSPADNDWAGAALRARTRNPNATVRERGTAALGLWQRAFRNAELDRDQVTKDLTALIAEFEDPGKRPDAYQGMQWVAATLRHVMARNMPVCSDWPQDVDKPWLRHFGEAVRHLNRTAIPPHMLPATQTLFEQALLQNAGVFRRQAVETLVAGGWTGPVTRAVARFLELEDTESWIRIRALFALGFLQHRDPVVEDALAAGCQFAYRNLARNPSQAQVHEMHAALFAVGDCYGAADVAEEHVRHIRERLREVLVGLVAGPLINRTALFSVSRAAAYLLTFMPLPRRDGKIDMAEELLTKLREHPDEITRELSDWALANRFGENGAILPLMHARI